MCLLELNDENDTEKIMKNKAVLRNQKNYV